MKPQTEKPGITAQELNACMGLPIDAPTKVSGGQLENFVKGWAKEIMHTDSSTAHWFVRDGFADARSLCGATVAVRWLYGPGNYPRCQNCIKTMSRQIRSGMHP